MNYKEALDYINGVSWLGSKPGLERVSELLTRLGEPQSKLRFVHVAGTNGKGSTSVMLASVLRRARLKTGLFTSPYVNRFNERMQINGHEIGDEELADVVERIKPHADAMDDHPTEFEMMTAAALLWFCEQGCDVVVCEVGLGGRLDATNVIPYPECSVITNIGLDHTAILGDTLSEIAYEKAGIIKNGCPVVLYQQSYEVTEVIRDVCCERGCELTVPDFDDIVPEFDSRDGQVFSYRGASYAIPLLGAHQLRNAVTVIETVNVLRKRGFEISDDELEAGLYAVSWPARFEILRDDPWFVVDGGHNPQCAEALRDCILKYFPNEKRVLLMGVLADKDYRSIVKILAPLFDAFVTVTPNSPRALDAKDLAALFEEYGREVKTADSIRDGVGLAVGMAQSLGAMVCACGSLYICGEIRECFVG